MLASLGIAALLIAAYAFAPTLAAAVPALEGVLTAYVDVANIVRDWIDGLLASGVDSLS